jgi:hypothetical protein
MVGKAFYCPSCRKPLPVKGVYHAGFNDVGFFYCDKDQTVLTFSAYDETYKELIPNKKPWAPYAGGNLTLQEQRLVEKHLRPCPCGGRFRFHNKPRCPSCGKSIATLVDSIHYIVLQTKVDGDKSHIWKDIHPRRVRNIRAE